MTTENLKYKKQNMIIWNELAPRYHKRWASLNDGPWKSTGKILELTKIKKGDTVLDLACGTGAVTKKISKKIGGKGHVIGIDTSFAAIKIAKKYNANKKNIDFINSDAERFYLKEKFDAITCQYALFFFPDSQRALKNMARNLKKTGILGITVHGNNTPYFSSILDIVTKFIPDYLPTGSARLDRFGKVSELRKEIKKASFRQVVVKEFIFSYSPGTFEDYWRNYRRYVAKPIKEKLNGLSRKDQSEIREQVKEKTRPFTKPDKKIVFPWQVLISTARSSL